MHIKISGLDHAVKQLKSYKHTLTDKQQLLMSRLAEIGIDVADVKFRTAQYDGDNDVVVNKSPEWDGENKLVITASGKSVTFIEFGAGVHYAEVHPKASDLGMVRGAFGQGKGSHDRWGYYGSPGTNGQVVRETDRGTVVLTQGNPPARAMYDAVKEMRAQILRIAREVYGG